MAKRKIIVVKTTVFTPSVPNYLKQIDGQMLPIEAVSDTGLKLIGKVFTEELIEKAHRNRKAAGRP